MEHANWNLIPDHMQDGVRLWIEHGVAPGSFMTAVLCNDLSGALGRADEINRARLHDIVSFFYNYAPGDCWGSPDHFHGWMKRGGLSGLASDAA